MESGGNDGEQSEGDNLKSDTDHGNVSAPVQLVLGVLVSWRRSGDHDGTDELEQERNDVEADKDGSDPSSGHPEELCGSVLRGDDEEYDSSEHDIDDTGHQNRCQNDKTELRDVEALVGRVAGGLDSCSVTTCLHCCLSGLYPLQALIQLMA